MYYVHLFFVFTTFTLEQFFNLLIYILIINTLKRLNVHLDSSHTFPVSRKSKQRFSSEFVVQTMLEEITIILCRGGHPVPLTPAFIMTEPTHALTSKHVLVAVVSFSQSRDHLA